MSALAILLTGLALLGHAIFWVGLANKSHATGFPRRLITVLSASAHAAFISIPLAFAWRLSRDLSWTSPDVGMDGWPVAIRCYVAFCCVVALVHVPRWFWQRLHPSSATILEQQRAEMIDIAQRIGKNPLSGLSAAVMSCVPGNQLLKLEVNEKRLTLRQLPAAFEGLSIVHLSDLHFSGRVGPEYFQAVVDEANRLDADLVAVTGDICDKAYCVDWIPQILGRLNSRHGKFFVLGNHDLKVRDEARVRRAFADAGFVDLGGRTHTLQVGGGELLLAGNELPWFAPAADVPIPKQAGNSSDARLAILLAHSPDQFRWGRAREFDLILAGHTHGGQIRLPLIGPIVSPSWSGVQYASGTFFKSPTILHVSRGVSSYTPLRLNCSPELTKLILSRRGDG